MTKHFLAIVSFGLLLVLNPVPLAWPFIARPTTSALMVNSTLLPGFQDSLLASNLGVPMDMAWTPDGRMLIPTQTGQLRVYFNGALLPTPAVDLSGTLCTDGERGLGGTAVHPNFASNHFIYLYYTFKKFGTCNESENDGPVNRLSRFTLANNIVDPASEVVLLDTPPLPTGFHMAGDLKFGNDSYLYATIGDGGTACCSSHPEWPQDPGVIFGKVLRVTDSGGIPPGNPFTGPDSARCNQAGVPPSGSPPGTKCQEVYALGLRNPFRFAFDPNAFGVRFFINDVGENDWEEVDEGQLGANYGWPAREGPCARGSTTNCGPPPSGTSNPIFWYGHNVTVDGSPCNAVTGAAFVPNGFWQSSFDNGYLLADWVCGQIWMLKPNGQGGYTRSDFANVGFGIVSMRFGAFVTSQALFYVTNAGTGELRRISSLYSPSVGGGGRYYRT